MIGFLAAAVTALVAMPTAAHAAKPTVYRLAPDGLWPQLGVDARGGAIAAWQGYAPKLGGIRYEQTSAVIVSRRRPGGGFDKPRPVTRLDLDVSTFALDVGSSGDGAIAWLTKKRGAPLYVQRRRPGKAFGSAAVLPGSRGAGEPAVAIDARGQLVVAWLRPARNTRCGKVVMATVAPRGGQFRRPERVSDGCAHAGWLLAALAREGNGAVAWRSSGPRSAVSRSTIRVSPFADGRFRAARAASAVGNVGEAFALAGGGRRTLAVWRDKGAAANRVLAASIDGDRVGPPVEVASTRDTLLGSISVAMSPRDGAIVAWHRAPRGSSVWDAFATGEVAIRAAAEGGFGPPDIVAPEIEMASELGLTGLALDARGRALAGYDDVVRRRPATGPWGPAIALRHRADFSDPEWPPGGDEMSVGSSDAGEGVAVWDLEGADGGTDAIRAAVIPVPGDSASPRSGAADAGCSNALRRCAAPRAAPSAWAFPQAAAGSAATRRPRSRRPGPTRRSDGPWPGSR